jgi:hypothetical protein
LAITWSKFGVNENLKLQSHSNNYELSENAMKMTFFLISGQKIIMKGCTRIPGQVASTVHGYSVATPTLLSPLASLISFLASTQL